MRHAREQQIQAFIFANSLLSLVADYISKMGFSPHPENEVSDEESRIARYVTSAVSSTLYISEVILGVRYILYIWNKASDCNHRITNQLVVTQNM